MLTRTYFFEDFWWSWAPGRSFWRLILGILEALGRPKNHFWGSKSILRRRLCERRVALASPSGPQWPQVPPSRPQGPPKGAQKEPQEDPKWRENRSKILLYIKNLKFLKMKTLPHENHIFKGSKGPKIDPKASQIPFLAF